jgi:hypothetical protein
MFQNGVTLDALKHAGTKRQMLRIGYHVHPRQSKQVYVDIPFWLRAATTHIEIPAT